MSLTVVFIGGTGVISHSCAAAAVEAGMRVVLINRGRAPERVPIGAEVRSADVHDTEAMRAAFAGLEPDVVVDVLAFSPEDIDRDLALCPAGSQFVFISSASAYQTPPQELPVHETTPLENPFWSYSRLKAAAEQRVAELAPSRDVHYTIVRPSHTYDETYIPLDTGWTAIQRMREGRPVVVPGDGTSLWTITHARDFARAFVHLLGEPRAYGEAFHITGDEAPTWDAIHRMLGAAAGVPDPHLVHVASEAIAAVDPEWGVSLLGDKAHSMLFDNSKIRTIVPDFKTQTRFADGAREIIAWYDADPARRVVDPQVDDILDRLIAAYGPRPL
jgi:nucleoside-diphosphate-sugar epimerase